jgi:hypothetical protein
VSISAKAGFTVSVLALAGGTLSLPQTASAETGGEPDDTQIVVTAARTILPPNALPLTVEVIDKASLEQQMAISGSVTDAVATLIPSFSPTRQKLSGRAKRCADARRSMPSTAFRNPRRCATAAAMASPSTASSSIGWK